MRALTGSITRVFLLLLIPIAAYAQPTDAAPGERYRVEFGTAWWQPSPALTIQTERLANGGIREFDFAEEFNFDKKLFSEFRLVLKPGRAHKVRVSYVPVRFSQTAELLQPIQFDGEIFQGAAAADVEWKLWRFGYEWDFAIRERGFFGLVADLKYNQVSAGVQARGLAAAVDANAPIPGIGVIGRGYVHPKVQISGEVTGFKMVGDVEGSLFDFDVSATFNVFRTFGVHGGFRSVRADYTVDGDTGDLRLTGPYFGIVSRF